MTTSEPYTFHRNWRTYIEWLQVYVVKGEIEIENILINLGLVARRKNKSNVFEPEKYDHGKVCIIIIGTYFC